MSTFEAELARALKDISQTKATQPQAPIAPIALDGSLTRAKHAEAIDARLDARVDEGTAIWRELPREEQTDANLVASVAGVLCRHLGTEISAVYDFALGLQARLSKLEGEIQRPGTEHTAEANARVFPRPTSSEGT